MNQNHDTSQSKPEENSLSDFECLLKGHSPVPVEVDTSIFDAHVSAGIGELHAAQARHAPWPVAAASWFVGLATGLLVAVLAGGAFRAAPEFPLTALGTKALEEAGQPVKQADNSVKPINDAEASVRTPTTPLPDYIDAFSPNNPNFTRSMDYASRGLLVSLSATDDAGASSRSGQPSQPRHFGQAAAPPQSTTFGSLRKQLPL